MKTKILFTFVMWGAGAARESPPPDAVRNARGAHKCGPPTGPSLIDSKMRRNGPKSSIIRMAGGRGEDQQVATIG